MQASPAKLQVLREVALSPKKEDAGKAVREGRALSPKASPGSLAKHRRKR